MGVQCCEPPVVIKERLKDVITHRHKVLWLKPLTLHDVGGLVSGTKERRLILEYPKPYRSHV
jgi:hypothetical protein